MKTLTTIKKTLAVSFIALTFITGTASGSALTFASEQELTGSAAAFADSNFTLQEMLTYAIQDEYAAQAEYDAIIKAFNTARPYTNILRAEGTHISLLVPLFETYGYEVPDNDAIENLVLPASLIQSYSIGVEAEINNITMYESFLEQDLPPDVANIFTYLKDASENHLAAFEKQVNRSSGSTRGFSRRGLW